MNLKLNKERFVMNKQEIVNKLQEVTNLITPLKGLSIIEGNRLLGTMNNIAEFILAIPEEKEVDNGDSNTT